MKRIGIFGGTFDPIHNGHLTLATEAKKQAKLDCVVFMPAKLQPFKLDQKVTEAEFRLAMIKLAIEGMEGLQVSTCELDSPKVSYTFSTMRAMTREYPKDRLYFITGTDTFLKIEIWKNAEEMLTSYSYIVGQRPGYKEKELKLHIKKIQEKYHTEIVLVDSPMPDVSSTEIRAAIDKEHVSSGKIPAGLNKECVSSIDIQKGQIRELTPESVERYIRDHDLY